MSQYISTFRIPASSFSQFFRNFRLLPATFICIRRFFFSSDLPPHSFPNNRWDLCLPVQSSHLRSCIYSLLTYNLYICHKEPLCWKRATCSIHWERTRFLKEDSSSLLQKYRFLRIIPRSAPPPVITAVPPAIPSSPAATEPPPMAALNVLSESSSKRIVPFYDLLF